MKSPTGQHQTRRPSQLRGPPNRERAVAYNSKKQSASQQLRIRLANAGERADDAPEDSQKGDVAGRRQPLEDQVGGNLKDQESDVEDGNEHLELVSVEMEVLGHFVQTSISDVDTVDGPQVSKVTSRKSPKCLGRRW